MTKPVCPFPGPRPLSEGHRLFSRDRIASADELINRITADRIVLLYSPSGAGKSSLLNAGLIPEMKHRGVAVRNTIRVNGAPDPASSRNEIRRGVNRYTLSCLDSLGIPVGAPARLAQFLGHPDEDELLIFDQFEEILTADPLDESGRREFFRQLGEALRIPAWYAVFAIREDYLAMLQNYVIWLPGQLTSRMRLVNWPGSQMT